MTFGTTVGVPLAKKLLKQCYDAGVNLCGPPWFQRRASVLQLSSPLFASQNEARHSHSSVPCSFDNAEVYSDGKAEEVMGQAFKA